jgi:hypothetical protein
VTIKLQALADRLERRGLADRHEGLDAAGRLRDGDVLRIGRNFLADGLGRAACALVLARGLVLPTCEGARVDHRDAVGARLRDAHVEHVAQLELGFALGLDCAAVGRGDLQAVERMGAWFATNRSFDTAASTLTVSALENTVDEGSSQALCAMDSGSNGRQGDGEGGGAQDGAGHGGP